jgi:Rrf2 family protein
MKIPSKSRYGTRIAVYLACRYGTGTVSTKEVAEAEGISFDYAEQILLKLKTGGLVRSVRGARGGFELTSPPERLSVADVLNAVEGESRLANCIDDSSSCCMAKTCVTREVWEKADTALADIFGAATLASLAEKKRRIEEESTINYQI